MTDSLGVVQHVGYVDSLKVAISICLTYTLLVSGVRIYLRNSKYGLDDLFLVIATVVTLIHFFTSYAALARGMGRPDTTLPVSLDSLNASAVAGVVTFILALYTAKVTAFVFLLRITSVKKIRVLYYGCIAASVVFGIVSIFVVPVGCPASSGYYWNFAGNASQCSTQYTKWQIMTVLDVISEIVLLALPIQLVWSLQMPSQKKLVVVATFWTRLPTIGLTLVRQHYVKRLFLENEEDKSLGSAIVLILMEIEVTYALVSCTIATSKSFTDLFNTGWGMGPIRGAAETYNMSNVGKNGSSGMRTGKGSTMDMNTSFNSVRPERATETDQRRSMPPAPQRKNSASNGLSQDTSLKLRPENNGKTQTMIHSSPRHWGDEGSLNSDPEDSVIVRQMEYSITHDEAPILPRLKDRRR